MKTPASSVLQNDVRSSKRGFTLLELLIVIAILAILGAVVIFTLNPAETLKKSRDAQRISDLATIKTALGLYITSTSTPYLASNTDNTACRSSDGAAYAAGDWIFYSASSDVSSTTDNVFDGGAAGIPAARQQTTANYRKVDSNGWIPVNLKTLTSGSPLDAWPVDPSNTFIANDANGASSTVAAVTTAALVYRYACEATNLTFEVDARLESNEYTTGTGNRLTTDGGNNSMLYEVGTSLTLLGTTGDF